ncbi:MAG: nucleotidyl transferase AbiEii/AbiGii toxin family protein [Acidobacteriota bacterium]|nr:nucleotidyl transferase AbiEii/AbiGii toxin family protein [Acidobacteriota bacterium]
MAALVLPSGPAELLERTREPLAAHLGGEHHLCLGGGTALAARWAHRHSTDVDYFIKPEPYARLHANAEQFARDLERATGVRDLSVGPSGTRIILADGGEVSVSTTPGFTGDPRSEDTVRGTAIGLETSAEILARKIGGRILGNSVFVPRDLYDIAVSRQCDPDAFATACSRFTDRQLRDIAIELRSLHPDWMETHHRPIVAPAFPGAARNAAFTVRDLFQHRHNLTWDR